MSQAQTIPTVFQSLPIGATFHFDNDLLKKKHRKTAGNWAEITSGEIGIRVKSDWLVCEVDADSLDTAKAIAQQALTTIETN